MNIPPKYEDVVAQLEVAIGREAALREELTKFKAGCVDQSSQVRELEHKMDYYKGEGLRADALQQRLTVAERRAFELTGLLKLSLLAVDDVAENCEDQTDWATANSMHALSKRITEALKPAEEGEGS